MAYRRAVALLTLALVSACTHRAEQTRGTASADSLHARPTAQAPATSLPEHIAKEIAQLEDVSLAAWRGVRGESLAARTRRTPFDVGGRMCAFTLRQDTVFGRALRRYAVFYPPLPPTPLVWPSATGDALRDAGCRLGLIWVDVPVSDTSQGGRLADSIRASIDRLAGPGRYDVSMYFFGAAYWTHRARWQRGSATIAAAVDRMALQDTGDVGTSVRVIAFTYLPVSRLTLDLGGHLGDEDEVPADTFPLERAVALSGADTAAWGQLRSALRAADQWNNSVRTARATLSSSSLIGPLTTWLQAAAPLPPPRRAAALFVADQVLERTRCPFQLCARRDSAKLEPLRALGADFVWSELGGSWNYTRTWLVEAGTLDATGPIGEAVFLVLLRRGFDISGMCSEGGDEFRRVIREGEAFLAAHPGSPHQAEVRFLVAEAYRDIVALANGAVADYADSSEYADEAPEAARSALADYRGVLGAGDTSATARVAWQRAFGLLAGIPPHGTRFFCVYD